MLNSKNQVHMKVEHTSCYSMAQLYFLHCVRLAMAIALPLAAILFQSTSPTASTNTLETTANNIEFLLMKNNMDKYF
jgi:hypothetical protein